MSENNENSKYQFHSLEFSAAELPKITENVNKGIVFFGEDNLYPNTLIELYRSSAIHNAVVTAKARAVAGDSVELEGEATAEMKALFNRWSLAPNPDEDLADLLEKISLDYQIQNAFCLEVIWSKDGSEITELNHLNPKTIRFCPMVDGTITHVQYSRDWSQTRKAQFAPIILPVFSPKNAKADGRQILYVKAYDGDLEYYGLPSYIGAMGYIRLDAELSTFHLATIQNGCMPSMHFSFKNGTPSAEEQQKLDNQIKRKYAGAANAGKYFLTFSDGSDNAPEFKAIEKSNIDQYFTILNDTITNTILTGHRVTSGMLLGVKEAGQLSGATELETAYEIFEKTVLAPDRNKIEKTFNRLLQYIIPGVKIRIVQPLPFKFTLSEAVLSKIMTVNELRKKIDLPELDEQTASQLQVKLSAVMCDCGKPLEQCDCSKKLNNAA